MSAVSIGLDASTEDDMTASDGEIRIQIHKIVTSILSITKDLELVLCNIRCLTQTIHSISNKVSDGNAISADDRDVLIQAEKWLREDNVAELPTALFGKLNDVIEKIQSYSNDEQRKSASSTKAPSNVHQKRLSICSVLTNGTIDEGEELDWDGNGVELLEQSGSYHSSTQGLKAISFIDPYQCLKMLSESDSDPSCVGPSESVEHSVICTSDSYHGIYEEEMEMTLELEEGFYSDSSISGTAEDSFSKDRSPQADSGVTQLDCITASIERSVSHTETEIGETIQEVEEDPTTQEGLTADDSPDGYNKHINTWDTYAMVNIEDDLQSTASELSNTSTPQLKRRAAMMNSISGFQRDSMLSIDEGTSSTGARKQQTRSLMSSLTDLRVTDDDSALLALLDSMPSNGWGPVDPKATSNSGKIGPSNSTKDLGNSKAGSLHTITTSMESSTDTTVLSDGYTKSTPPMSSMSPSLRQNNYFRKSRRAVFV